MISKRIVKDMKSQAETDISEGRIEVVEQLKGTPVSELHHCDPTMFARITPDQRADIFSHIAQQTKASDPVATPNMVRYKQRTTYPIWRFWCALPLAVRSQFMGLLLSTAMAGLFLTALINEEQISSFVSLPASLSSNTSYWPKCNRLTPSIDGCIYIVTDSLSWRDAATILGFDPKVGNRHLANRRILQRGDKLIVWRKKIPLEN